MSKSKAVVARRKKVSGSVPRISRWPRNKLAMGLDLLVLQEGLEDQGLEACLRVKWVRRFQSVGRLALQNHIACSTLRYSARLLLDLGFRTAGMLRP